MRKVSAVVAALALTVNCPATWAANVTTNNEMYQQHSGIVAASIAQFPPCDMFDGIELTEHQRQQLRDLMRRARYERAPVSISDLEALHSLTTADQFDAAAYRARLEAIIQDEVNRQLEIARVRNQMYHLLTPQQQVASELNYQRRITEMRQLTERPQATSLQAISSSSNTR